jgi:hypothetical protein
MQRFASQVCTILLCVSAFILPPPALAGPDPTRISENPIGIVTTLSGQATVARGPLIRQQALPLKFRDELYVRDQITTKEHSTVKVLLGGKSLVTIRELSVLTITEELGLRSALHLPIGKVSIAVARSKMSPGETIEIRTPNAMATVRGTVFIVEVKPAFDYAIPSPTAGVNEFQPLRAPFSSETDLLQASNVITTFHVLKGHIDIRPLAGGNVPSVVLQAGMSLEIVGTVIGRPSLSPSVEHLVKDLKAAPQFPEDPTASRLDRIFDMNGQPSPSLPTGTLVHPPMTDRESHSSEPQS